MYKNIFASKKQLTVVTYNATVGGTTTPREFILHHESDADVLAMAKAWMLENIGGAIITSTPTVRYTVPLEGLIKFESDYTLQGKATPTHDIIKGLIDLYGPIKDASEKAKTTGSKTLEDLQEMLKDVLDMDKEVNILDKIKSPFIFPKPLSECIKGQEGYDETPETLHSYILKTPIGDTTFTDVVHPKCDSFKAQFVKLLDDCCITPLDGVKAVVNGDIKIIATTDPIQSIKLGVDLIMQSAIKKDAFEGTIKVPEYTYGFKTISANSTKRHIITATDFKSAKDMLFTVVDTTGVDTIKLEETTDPRITK